MQLTNWIVNHCSNVIGTIQPIADIGKICRDADVYFAVDTSQTAGIQDIDIKKMNIDMLAFTGHKCLMGPTGIGGLYICNDVPIKAIRFGGTGIDSIQALHPEEFPFRMECGTLLAGQKWIKKEGMENIHQREMKLWDKLRTSLQNTEGVITYCADAVENHNSVLSFNISGMESGCVGAMLDMDYNIAVRTGLQCAPLVHEHMGTDKIHGTVRLSIGPFNTEKDIDTTIMAIREIASVEK